MTYYSILSIAQNIPSEWKPKIKGAEIRLRCPVHQGKNQSLCIKNGNNGGLMLKCHSKNCSYHSIKQCLIDNRVIFGYKGDFKQQSNLPNKTAVVNNDSDFTPVTVSDVSGFSKKCSAKYVYYDSNGNIFGLVARFQSGNKKQFFPYRYGYIKKNGETYAAGWYSTGFGANRPLFHLLEISKRPQATILVVEGEKACLAAQEIFPKFVVVTSQGGAHAAKQSNWSVLKNKHVIIWSDYDEAGDAYKNDVVKLATSNGAISIKSIPNNIFQKHIVENKKIKKRKNNLPNGYDAADALCEGWTAELIKEVIEM